MTTMEADICPQCAHGNHDQCMADPEEGLLCECPDPSHGEAKKIEGRPV